MRRRTPILVVSLVAAFAACHRSSGADAPPASPAPVVDPGPVAIAPGAGRDGLQVRVDGQAVWPPRGPGCEQLVRCCEQGTPQDGTTPLFCQLAVAAQPGDCPGALGRVRSYVIERGHTVPPECR